MTCAHRLSPGVFFDSESGHDPDSRMTISLPAQDSGRRHIRRLSVGMQRFGNVPVKVSLLAPLDPRRQGSILPWCRTSFAFTMKITCSARFVA